MNASVRVNAWEVETEAQAVNALAGRSTAEEIARDREQRADEMAQLFRVTPESVGFEIGSGNGIVARSLSKRCGQLDCNDISRSFLARARETCGDAPNARFHLIENDYLAHLPAGGYDFGYSLSVFIHLNPYDVFNYLSDVARILRPGGLFFFDTCSFGPATADLFLEHAGYYRQDPAGVRGLLCFNDPQVIVALAKEAGLRVVKQYGSGGWMNYLVRRP